MAALVMRKLSLVSIVVLFIGLVAFASDTVIEEIVARVNSAIITRNDYDKAKQQLVNEAKEKGGISDQELAKHEQDVLRDLIDQQLLLQKGTELGITGDTELIKRLDDMRKEMGLNSMEELEQAAEKQGVSYEDYKQNMRNNIITQDVIGQEVGSHIQITKEEQQKFYDEHKSQMERPEQVVLSEILISPTKPVAEGQPAAADPSPAQLAAAEKNANDVLNDLKKGANFADEAKKYSDGPTAKDGGQLGAFARGTLAKELEDKTFPLKAGQFTDVIRTKQGFIILRVDQHQEAGIPPLKDITNDVQQAIYLQKLQPALRTYLTKLREEAFIDIKEGYVDSAASPNETKPVYMAADTKPEGKAARKHKKKFLIF
jgi:peptidyl-prolyl cis-trans isomerase SurA